MAMLMLLMLLMLMIMMMLLLFLMLLLVMSLVVNLYSVQCRRGAMMVAGACLGRVHAHPDEEPITAA
jgi:hypothetical protein